MDVARKETAFREFDCFPEEVWAMIFPGKESILPRKHSQTKPDRLLQQLQESEAQLQRWIESSSGNARWFRKDPIAAMRAAGLEIDDDIMLELETIIGDIARRLK